MPEVAKEATGGNVCSRVAALMACISSAFFSTRIFTMSEPDACAAAVADWTDGDETMFIAFCRHAR